MIGIRISGLVKIVLRIADLFRGDENIPSRVEGFSLKAISSRRIFIADHNE